MVNPICCHVVFVALQLLAAIASLSLAIEAGAGDPPPSVVSVEGGVVRFEAAAGTVNDIRVSMAAAAAGQYRVTLVDTLHPAVRGDAPGCVDAGPAIRCDGAFVAVEVYAGDLDDEVSLSGGYLPGFVFGGEGADRLEGDDHDDELHGGPGDDLLYGERGNDHLLGEEGADFLSGDSHDDLLDGGPGPDRMRGRTGTDTVSYADRLNPVSVTLDNAANDGEAGEGDDVENDVELVVEPTLPTTLAVTGGVLRLQASPGKSNSVFVFRFGGPFTVVDDATLTIAPGTTACSFPDPEDRTTATCIAAGVGSIEVDSGDRDDFITISSGVRSVIRAGSGNDELTGGNGDDRLDGGPGADVIIGGSGMDTADYLDRVGVVRVSPGDIADDGEQGEGDDVRQDVELVDAPSLQGRLTKIAVLGGAGLKVTQVFRPGGLFLRHSEQNPIFEDRNIYAPDFIREGPRWYAYFGGWTFRFPFPDTADRIYMAISNDLIPEHGWSPTDANLVIDHGDFPHVNDPSVARRAANDWVMAYTVGTGSQIHENWVAISTSTNGLSWSPNAATQTAFINVSGAQFIAMKQPSLVWTGDRWKLWFDGIIQGGDLMSHLVESTEWIPHNFVYVRSYPLDTVLQATDVQLIDGKYMAINDAFAEIFGIPTALYVSESTDGVNFTVVGEVLRTSEFGFPRQIVDNPGWLYDRVTNELKGIAYGYADYLPETEWKFGEQDIGFSHMQLRVRALTCPNVWHEDATAVSQTQVTLAGPGTGTPYCRIVIEDPVTGEIFADQPLQATEGERWQYLPRACSDRVDNDGDGAKDFPDDPGCWAAVDDSE